MNRTSLKVLINYGNLDSKGKGVAVIMLDNPFIAERIEIVPQELNILFFL